MHTTEEIKTWINDELSNSMDVTSQTLEHNKLVAHMIFIHSIANNSLIHEMIVKPFFHYKNKEQFLQYVESLGICKKERNKDELLTGITKGNLLLWIDENVYLIQTKENKNNAIFSTNIESTVQGPQQAFSEDVMTNLNMIRLLYAHSDLTIEQVTLQTKSKTSVVILYDKSSVNKAVLHEMKHQLQKINEPIVLSSSDLQKYLIKRKLTLFPTAMLTERPDRTMYNISQGKIVLMMDGTPFVLIGPAIFYDFLSSMDDLYHSYWSTKFLKILRYTGLFISLILPSAYVAISSFNPEIFRVQLALSIAGSRMAVPYPSFMEVLFMLVMMELLIEASLRLPKSISSTATTVGGLILGTAATEAGLVSNIMIIIVSAVAISNFAIPINEMTFAVRTAKYLILLCGSFFGSLGIVVSMLWLVIHLVSLDSFGEPYLKIYLQPKHKETSGGS